MTRPLLVVIAGPTAVGKTDLAIKLAQSYQTEIVSCDSRQVYKELGVGVAKPTKAELLAVKHHFIDHCSIHDEFNAGVFEKESNALLNHLFTKHKVVFMVGGTGLYIKSCIVGLNQLPGANEELRSELKDKSTDELKTTLHQLDPEAELKDSDNPQRLIRAIEIIKSTGMSLKASYNSVKAQRPYNTLLLFVNKEREALYNNINKRVDIMVNDGLEKEAKALYPFKDINALQTVGYKEWFEFFDGKYDRSTAIAKIKQHSRNYAKRQVTWFKNQSFIEVENNFDQVDQKIKALL